MTDIDSVTTLRQKKSSNTCFPPRQRHKNPNPPSDLCNEQLPKEANNIQYRNNVLDEIDDSFESEHDKHEPRLSLCPICTKRYNIPSYL